MNWRVKETLPGHRAFSRHAPSDASVEAGHKSYLLFRDLAAISLLQTVVAPVGARLLEGGLRSVLLLGALMLGQYLLAAIAARNSGILFVTNVLVIHSARRVTVTPAARAKPA